MKKENVEIFAFVYHLQYVIKYIDANEIVPNACGYISREELLCELENIAEEAAGKI